MAMMDSGTPAPNRNTVLIAVSTAFSTISAVCLLARLVSRRVQKQKFTIDDFLLIACWAIAFVETVMIAASMKYGKFGHHINTLTLDNRIGLMKAMYASNFLQTSSLALAKISLIIFLYRIFFIVEGFKRTCWILGAIVISWWIAAFFSNAFICLPVSHTWMPESKGTCGNQYLDLIIPLPWILTDLAILVAPMLVVCQLQLAGAQKTKVYVEFLIGTITCVVSLLMLLIFVQLISKLNDDFSWSLVPIALGNIIEVHVTVMCPALMASGPIISLIYSKLRSQSTASTSSIEPSSDLAGRDRTRSPGSEVSDKSSFKGLYESDDESWSGFKTVPECMTKLEEEDQTNSKKKYIV